MGKRQHKCSCKKDKRRVELKRYKRILRKLDEEDIEEILPDDCFMQGDLFCCRVNGRIICIE